MVFMHSLKKLIWLVCAIGLGSAGAAERTLAPSASVGPQATERVTKLDPYNVSAAFSAIRVRFVLSRQNLFDPTNDPIVEARVVEVGAAPGADETDLQLHDVLTGLNGTALNGLTLRQIAALVATAREQGNCVWTVRRGLATVEILHNGNWLTPLPGLTH